MKNILIIACIIAVLSACDSSYSKVETEQKAIYSSQSFHPESQVKKHKITAFVEPTDNAFLSFQVAGTISQEHVIIGDVVEQNDALFQIKNPALGPRITQLGAEISAIEATIDQNEAELKRLQNLKKSNAVSQNDLDRLVHQKDNLLAKKRSLQSQQQEAQSLFNETSLIAPFMGTVAEIYKKKGETIAAGEPVMLLGGVDSLQAPMFVPSHLQKSLTIGQTIETHYQGQPFNATVKEISHAANPKSQLFKLILDIPMELGMKSGEQVVSYVPEQLGEHYALPFEAVVDDGINKPYLMVIVQGVVKQIFVDVMALQGETILLGLSAESSGLERIEVVTQGHSHLTIGQTVSQAEKES